MEHNMDGLDNKRLVWLMKLFLCPYTKSDVPLIGIKSGTFSDLSKYLGYKHSTGSVNRFLKELKEKQVLLVHRFEKGKWYYYVDKDGLQDIFIKTETYKLSRSIAIWHKRI